MKKTLSFLLCLVFILVSVSAVSAAQPQDKTKVVFSATEITDQKDLQERLDKGITDDKDFTANCILSQDTIKGDDGKEYKIKVVSVKATTQKLKETITNNADTSEYSGNIVAIVSVVPSGGDDTSWSYDSSQSAKIYVHCVYLWGVVNNNPYYKVTQLSGKVTLLTSQLTLNKIEITEHCFGIRYTDLDESTYVGQGVYDMTAYANNPAQDVYYYNNSLSPYYWNIADGSQCQVRGTVTGYLQRGGTQWNASVDWHRP